MEFVGQTIHGDRVESGIAEDDFVQTLAGRVTVVGRLHIGGQQLAQSRYSLEKRDGDRLSFGLEIVLSWNTIILLFPNSRFVLQRAPDLRGQFVVQAVDQIAGVVSHVADVEPFSAAIAGINNFLEIICRKLKRSDSCWGTPTTC